MGNDPGKIFDPLGNITIFAGISPERLNRTVCSRCTIVSLQKGHVVFREETEATEIYIILSGRVRVTLIKDGKPFELVQLGAGLCIGEASVIGIQRHSATVEVMDDAQFMVLSRKALMEIYRDDVDLFALLILNIARELARRLYYTDRKVLCANPNDPSLFY